MGLRETLQEIHDQILDGHANGANEESAKQWFVTPVLRELGWHGPGRLVLEHPAGRERVRMDFALLGDRRVVAALIEAKAPNTDLTAYVGQVLGYAFHEGVDICALTTGVVWWLYLPREKGDPEGRRFAVLDLQHGDLDEINRTLHTCLEFTRLTSGSGVEHAREMLLSLENERVASEEIPKAWLRLLEGPDELLVELVQAEVEKEIGFRPPVDLIVRSMQGFSPKTQAPSPIQRLDRPSRPQPASSPVLPTPRVSTRRQKGAPTRVTEYRIWGQSYPVRHQYEVLAGVADMLFARHADSFERALQIARFRRDNSGLRRPHRIGSSNYYVELSLSFKDMRRTTERLLETFGYDSTDLDILED